MLALVNKSTVIVFIVKNMPNAGDGEAGDSGQGPWRTKLRDLPARPHCLYNLEVSAWMSAHSPSLRGGGREPKSGIVMNNSCCI